MLQLTIAGTLGKDPELRQMPTGSSVLNFSVAVSGYDFKAKSKTTTWVRVAIWGKRGETLVKLLAKGSKVAVTGEMTLNVYNGKTSVEIKAQDVTLLGGGRTREERGVAVNFPAEDVGSGIPYGDREGDDDVPF